MISINQSEFSSLMFAIGYFEPAPNIVVATSGGADSMALLLLANDWVQPFGGKVIALTINHNLRPESKDEAMQVKAWCENYGIEHHILTWEHNTPVKSAIQETAREARYRLLTDWCRENHILHLLTAHHCDDQVETMFFRLARGSGLEGLSAMSAQKIVSGVRLLRPFLQISKSRLIATLQDRRQEWLEDPSNQNPLYGRVNIRSQLENYEHNENIKNRASYLTNFLGKFRNLLENKLASCLTETIEIYPQGYACINTREFFLLDKEIATKAIASLIQAVSGLPHPPRSKKLLHLCDIINSGKLYSKRSLGGAIFEQSENKIIVYREAKAIEKSRTVPENTLIIWDNRFLVKWQRTENSFSDIQLEVRSLGSDGLTQIQKLSPSLLKNSHPARILRTFPSLWLLEELVSAPHIGYMSKNLNFPKIIANIKFCPAKPLAASSFFVMNGGLNMKFQERK